MVQEVHNTENSGRAIAISREINCVTKALGELENEVDPNKVWSKYTDLQKETYREDDDMNLVEVGDLVDYNESEGKIKVIHRDKKEAYLNGTVPPKAEEDGYNTPLYPLQSNVNTPELDELEDKADIRNIWGKYADGDTSLTKNITPLESKNDIDLDISIPKIGEMNIPDMRTFVQADSTSTDSLERDMATTEGNPSLLNSNQPENVDERPEIESTKYDYSDVLERFNEMPEMLEAFENVDFNPSPQELELIFLMAQKESGFAWDPKLNTLKKDKISSVVDELQILAENNFVRTILSEKEKQAVLNLKSDLQDNILNNNKATEYDLYMYTRRVKSLVDDIEKNHAVITTMIPGFESKQMRLEHEPRTFGVFQVDVNLLASKVRNNPSVLENYPEIFTDGAVNREELIKALSGREDAVMDRTKTMEFLTETYLKPRHDNHMRGEPEDLKYFAMESLSGEMSTYRAAVQDRLNTVLSLNPSLVLDGDLSFYKPYSVEIDWEKTSNTQRALSEFIEEEALDLLTNKDGLVKEICEADSWEKLKSSVLYQRIMEGEGVAERITPEIRSELYGQSVDKYTEVILSSLQSKEQYEGVTVHNNFSARSLHQMKPGETQNKIGDLQIYKIRNSGRRNGEIPEDYSKIPTIECNTTKEYILLHGSGNWYNPKLSEQENRLKADENLIEQGRTNADFAFGILSDGRVVQFFDENLGSGAGGPIAKLNGDLDINPKGIAFEFALPTDPNFKADPNRGESQEAGEVLDPTPAQRSAAKKLIAHIEEVHNRKLTVTLSSQVVRDNEGRLLVEHGAHGDTQSWIRKEKQGLLEDMGVDVTSLREQTRIPEFSSSGEKMDFIFNVEEKISSLAEESQKYPEFASAYDRSIRYLKNFLYDQVRETGRKNTDGPARDKESLPWNEKFDFTIDDGPHRNDVQLAQQAVEHGAKTTFFWTGEQFLTENGRNELRTMLKAGENFFGHMNKEDWREWMRKNISEESQRVAQEVYGLAKEHPENVRIEYHGVFHPNSGNTEIGGIAKDASGKEINGGVQLKSQHHLRKQGREMIADDISFFELIMQTALNGKGAEYRVSQVRLPGTNDIHGLADDYIENLPLEVGYVGWGKNDTHDYHHNNWDNSKVDEISSMDPQYPVLLHSKYSEDLFDQMVKDGEQNFLAFN